jgi:hypothetical protein
MMLLTGGSRIINFAVAIVDEVVSKRQAGETGELNEENVR